MAPLAAEAIPKRAGAYLLVIVLERALGLQVAGQSARLPPGHYAYCGSARGPGGLRARVGRHLRPEKRPHWHIDALTGAGHITGVAWSEGANECSLLAWVQALPGAAVPVPGFGSSDCRRCPAHLVAFEGEPAVVRDAVAAQPVFTAAMWAPPEPIATGGTR